MPKYPDDSQRIGLDQWLALPWNSPFGCQDFAPFITRARVFGRPLEAHRPSGLPDQNPDSKFSDLNMMVQYGDLERTRQEFHDLLMAGGFELAEVVPTDLQ